ncbi:hypothetical protein P775_21845 [Puniceibacterium antarcticum]|uniref:Pilus assembly protein n=1 Tax=Puniceibacterium antarcticum TaxID=1206336 RepID=A0A2G8R951_9RHOB|nr:hypothetical protein [Puniceibacterium antarcticum]PIL18067.1 hypothetical protein P775_21845 [Puniceibacterium antarcticum]
MFNFLKTVRNNETGAVTVDWIVLSAALIGLAVASYTAMDGGTNALISTSDGSTAIESDS